jgi:hypothetical protein
MTRSRTEYPKAPPHIRKLGDAAHAEDCYWSLTALAVMDKAFCDAVMRAHPERLVYSYAALPR